MVAAEVQSRRDPEAAGTGGTRTADTATTTTSATALGTVAAVAGAFATTRPEGCLFGNLHRKHPAAARFERAPSPKDHAAGIRVAGRDALRKEVPPLMPSRG